LSIAAEPQTAATCQDPPTPPPIDVVALSVNLPDGVYFAGKRFYSVSKKERWEYRQNSTSPDHEERYGKRQVELGRRLAGQTVVVRWEVSGGKACEPERLRDRLTDGVTPTEHRFYDWGPDGDWGSLHYAVCKSVDGCRDSTNYIDAFRPLWESRGDEWVLAHADLRRLMARSDITRTVTTVIEAGDIIERDAVQTAQFAASAVK